MAQGDEISLYELGSINRIFDDDEDETASYSSGSALRTKANSHLCKRINKDDSVFRKGPAPLEDAKLKGDFEKSFKPGALNNSKSHGNGTQGNASSSGLLNYFEKLGHSPEGEIIDLEFIDSLLRVGADINVTDIYGQTIMHEVAREWSVDVAQACLERFADIDKADKYGRSPLHLACAVNYPEMIEWLVTNGADISRKTSGECQTPLHYAARYNALEAMNVLIDLGASILDRDYKAQMPLFVAADAGRAEACRLLLEKGAPAGIFNDGGISCLAIMVEKMPDVAKMALEQFQSFDNAIRRKYFYLNYLELETWRSTENKKGNPLRQSFARSPLQMIVQYDEQSLIVHPVILNLIQLKWNLFGKRNAFIVLAINMFYTFVWTAIGVTMPRNHIESFYSPLKEKWWRLVLELIGCLMTMIFIIQQVLNYRKERNRIETYKEWRTREVQRDLQFCHPQWPEERRFLISEISRINSSLKSTIFDWWILFEWLTFFSLLSIMVTRGLAIMYKDRFADSLHLRIVAVSLIFVWLRLMKFCRSFQALGPFITMLGHVIDATVKFGFLFFEIFIPYCCAFWIIFGAIKGTEFQNFNDLIYQVFMMTLVADYEFSQLTNTDKIMAQLLVGTYLAVAGVVCLNLYIALMSETFSRVWSDATANAYMSKATQLLATEMNLKEREADRVSNYLLDNCSPLIVQESSEEAAAFNEKELILSLSLKIEALSNISLKAAEDTNRLQKDVEALRLELLEMKQKEAQSMQNLLEKAHDTSMAKLKGLLTNVQEGIGGRIRRTILKDKTISDDYESDEEEEEKSSSIASFFSRKKK